MLSLYGRRSELSEFSQLTPGEGTITILTLSACILNHFSCVQPFATLWTAARQAPLSMQFSRQECWSGSPCPPPGNLHDPGTEPVSLTSPALAGGFFTTTTTWEALFPLYWEKLGSEEVKQFTQDPRVAKDGVGFNPHSGSLQSPPSEPPSKTTGDTHPHTQDGGTQPACSDMEQSSAWALENSGRVGPQALRAQRPPSQLPQPVSATQSQEAGRCVEGSALWLLWAPLRSPLKPSTSTHIDLGLILSPVPKKA